MRYKKKILVVEDRDDQWQLIRAAIKNSMPDTEAVWVKNSNQALDYLQAQPKQQLPNLILLDLYLPGRTDGWQCLEAIKLSKLGRLLPIIIFSQSDSREDIKGSYDLGCSSYLVKPLNPQEWLDYFTVLHNYWWHTVSLPPASFSYDQS